MKKRHIKMLVQVAQILPPVYIVRAHTTEMSLAHAYRLKDDGVELPEGLPTLTDWNKDKVAGIKTPALDQINHLRRLKKAYEEGQEQGVKEYIVWVKGYNEKFKEMYPDAEVKEVPEGLLKIASSKVGSFWRSLMIFLMSFSFVFKKNNADD
jgi:hypothetical protein